MATRTLAALRVADLMSTPILLSADATVREAAIVLAKARSSVVPVVSPGGSFAGVFGEADIHSRLSEVTHRFYSPAEFRVCIPLLGSRLPEGIWPDFLRVAWTPVREAVRRIDVIGPEDPVPMAFERMRRQGLESIPVVASKTVVGMLHADALTLRLLEFVLAMGGTGG